MWVDPRAGFHDRTPQDPGLKPWAGHPCPCGTALLRIAATRPMVSAIVEHRRLVDRTIVPPVADLEPFSRPAGTRAARPGFQPWVWDCRPRPISATTASNHSPSSTGNPPGT